MGQIHAISNKTIQQISPDHREGSDEFTGSLERIHTENEKLPSLQYFIDTVNEWQKQITNELPERSVVLLGTGIPEELIIAAGAHPIRILGGSHESCAWSDDLVPRDTDPASRSILGYLENPAISEDSDLLYIVPLHSDSMRKIAFLLKKEGRNVLTVDMPPVREDRTALKKWRKQMLLMMEEISDYTKEDVTKMNIQTARFYVSRCREAIRDFRMVLMKHRHVLTGSAKMLVEYSYYCAEDLEEWCRSLQILTREIAQAGRRTYPFAGRRPQVLLMGSPVIFPNYKIPFLMEEAGLDVCRCLDASTVFPDSASPFPKTFSMEQIIGKIACAWYKRDISPAYVSNFSLYGELDELLEGGNVEGVIYHVLKGQIDQDFELEEVENRFAEEGIPVFRLETDYQYQDVEQLRIRLEAFKEMLVNNQYEKERLAR